jgi:hypothetical protein
MADEKLDKDKLPERQKMEMGGSGTAKVSFKDALGGEVKIKSSTWSSTGPVVVTPDEKDPHGAKLFASGPGPATVTAVGATEEGHSATATSEIMVVEKDAPVEGKIDIAVTAAPVKKEPVKEPVKEHAPAR